MALLGLEAATSSVLRSGGIQVSTTAEAAGERCPRAPSRLPSVLGPTSLARDFEARAQAGLPDQPGAASAAAAAVMKTKMARVLVAGDDWAAQLRAALQARATRGAPHASLHLVVGEHNLSASRRVDCRQLHSAMA